MSLSCFLLFLLFPSTKPSLKLLGLLDFTRIPLDTLDDLLVLVGDDENDDGGRVSFTAFLEFLLSVPLTVRGSTDTSDRLIIYICFIHPLNLKIKKDYKRIIFSLLLDYI